MSFFFLAEVNDKHLVELFTNEKVELDSFENVLVSLYPDGKWISKDNVKRKKNHSKSHSFAIFDE